MLITLTHRSSAAELAAVQERACQLGAHAAHVLVKEHSAPQVFAPGLSTDGQQQLASEAHIASITSVKSPYALVSHELGCAPHVVSVGDCAIGGNEVVMMAGPCAVEHDAQVQACAEGAARAGARLLRGGAFKPRTSPHAFTGLKERGLDMLARAAAPFGLKVVTEVMDASDVALVASYADMLQVGARNMQNFTLLAAVGRQNKPVLLKRGLSATYEEWLLAAEHIRVQGNDQIVLCERGIRTFERGTRNTLDLAAVPVVKQMSPLPMVIDPSHGTGRRDAVIAMARAAVAVGADGLIVECHPEPEAAWSDGPQSLTLSSLEALADDVARIARAVGRSYSAKEGGRRGALRPDP